MRGLQRPEYQSDEKDIGTREAFEWSAKVDAPGQANWYKGPKSYWTERFARDDDGISFAEEDRDRGSLLNHYRRLLALRRAHPAFAGGSQRIVDSAPNVLVIDRSGGGERLLIVANLSDAPASYRTTGRDLLSGANVRGALRLAPYQATVVRVTRARPA
jgi:glycosidase